MAQPLLPDDLWVVIEPLLPPPQYPGPKGGRPPVENRPALIGILFVFSRHRWKVERTHAWFGGFRRLTIRYERRDDIHSASTSSPCVPSLTGSGRGCVSSS
jgi:transposase